jgi:hypothetical protein
MFVLWTPVETASIQFLPLSRWIGFDYPDVHRLYLQVDEMMSPFPATSGCSDIRRSHETAKAIGLCMFGTSGEQGCSLIEILSYCRWWSQYYLLLSRKQDSTSMNEWMSLVLAKHSVDSHVTMNMTAGVNGNVPDPWNEWQLSDLPSKITSTFTDITSYMRGQFEYDLHLLTSFDM